MNSAGGVEALALWVFGVLGAALLGTLGFFLRGLAADFRATAGQVATVVGTLSLHGQRFDGVERAQGKLEGKVETLERQRSEDSLTIRLQAREVDELKRTLSSYHEKLNRLQAGVLKGDA